MNSSEPDDTKEAEIDPSSLPGYVREQLSWYTNYTVQARRGYYSLELMAISFAGAVPVASAAGATPWVAAVLGSLAAAATSARHIFNFDRNWTGRAVTAERIKALIALFRLRQINDVQLVQDVAELVDQETTAWEYAVQSRYHGATRKSNG